MRSKLALGGLTLAVAFLLAINPVVVEAAGQITGSQIKNNSIKGKDVKDRSLAGRDVKDGTLTGSDVEEATLTGVNAAALNGQPASAYLDRVAFVTGPNAAIPAGSSNSLLGPLSMSVPAGVGFVTIHGSASFGGPDDGFGIYYAVDGACSTLGPEFDQAQYENTGTGSFAQGSATIHVAVPVTPGVHTFRLCSNNSAADLVARSLLVQTVATGSTGGTTPRPSGGPASVSPGRPGEAP